MIAVHRTAAFLLIAIEAAIAERALFVFEPYIALLALLALLGTPGLIRISLGRRGQLAVAIAVAAFLYFAVGVLIARNRLPILPVGNALHAVAWYLLTLQAFLMFLKQPGNRLPVYFPALGMAVLAYGGANTRHGAADPVFHAAAMACVVLTLIFWSSGETPNGGRKGLLIQGALLTAALSIAGAISTAVGIYRNDIDNAVFGFFGVFANTSAVGFSPDAALNSVTRLRYSAGNQVALRVKSDAPPGYMRGKAYDTYAHNKWESTPQEELALPIKDAAGNMAADAGLRYYRLAPAEQPMSWMDVALSVRSSGYLFAPLDCASIGIAGYTPALDANGNITAADMPAGIAYRAICSPRAARQPLHKAMRRRWTALPEDLDPRLKPLADELFASAATSRAKIEAVVAFFAANFTYSMNIEVPRGEEPLPYFLLTHRQGHCEYFATAATILLRMGGVPARYINGFVTAERNTFGGYWIARNKDAHAWLEAYDDAKGEWITVEPTVAAGLPTGETYQSGWFSAALDYVKYAALRLRNAISSGVWLTRLRATLLAGWPWLLACGVAAGAMLTALRLRRARRRGARRTMRPLPHETAALMRLRATMDARVRKWGYIRQPDETVHAFAQRLLRESNGAEHAQSIQQAAEWYTQYGRIRFSGKATPDAIQTLKQHLP